MQDLEETILSILKKINESSIDELNNIKIEESKTGKINRKIVNGQNVYVIPKEYFDRITKAVEDEKNRKLLIKKQNDIEFEKENNEMFGILAKNSDKKRYAQKDLATTNRKTAQKNSSTSKKRNIKNQPRRFKKEKRFIPVLKQILKILAALAATGIAVSAGAKATVDIAKDINDYKNVEASVEGWTEEKIGKEAESELKEMISEATKVNGDEISFSDEWKNPSTNSSTYTVTVKAGEKEYNHISERRDLVNFNNNSTLSGKVADLISKMKNAEGREDAIRALKDIKNFSDTYELKVEDNKLIEEKEVR